MFIHVLPGATHTMFIHLLPGATHTMLIHLLHKVAIVPLNDSHS